MRIFVLTVFTLMIVSLSAQNNKLPTLGSGELMSFRKDFAEDEITKREHFYFEILKELISIQTLLAENRISDLSDFLDEHSYMGFENKSFAKLMRDNDHNPDNIAITFTIEEDNSLSVSLMQISSDGSFKFLLPKEEILSLYANLVSGLVNDIGTNVSYELFTKIRETYLNKDDEANKNIEYESLGRYKFKIRDNDSILPTFNASNFVSWVDNRFVDYGGMFIYRVYGPGKIAWIDIAFPKWDNKEMNDEVLVDFLIRAYHPKNNSVISKDPFNTTFFMSVRKFNDRIWWDN